jgi:hypothetical protein
MGEIRVKDHVTPDLTPNEFSKSVDNLLRCWYGSNVRKCGYCGEAKIDGYVCSCGYDTCYSDEPDSEGKTYLVWSKVK